MAAVVRVWIDEGCITCDACEDTFPEVFHVTDDTCFIRAEARVDGGYDENRDSKSAVTSEFAAQLEIIEEAADECPVDVIIIAVETEGGEAEPAEESAAEAEEAAPAVVEVAEAAAAAEPAATEPAAAASGGLEELMQGERDLLLLIGSQSGNSEAVADDAAKAAPTYGLAPRIKMMDDISIGDLVGVRRVIIICSTWGEGDMPDTAEDLWQAANSSAAPKLPGTSFGVCSLGDTAYEFYCQSGKDWDGWFEKAGATRLLDRIDCDLDYEETSPPWIAEALAHVAAVDEAGNFHADALDDLRALAGPAETSRVAAGAAFDIPQMTQAERQATIKVFRYDPVTGESGHDVWQCALPAHMSVLETLRLLKGTQDGSLTFRDGAPDDPTTGLLVNGRLVLPGRVSISQFSHADEDALNLRIDPLPAYDVIRDLAVDLDSYQRHLAASRPWFRGATRDAAQLDQGVMGLMDAPTAASLHAAQDIASHQLLHSASDTVPHNRAYIGPAVLSRLWNRSQDPRISDAGRAALLAVIQGPDGVKAEADIASVNRQGRMGAVASANLYAAKRATLQAQHFTGRHGAHVWFFTQTVKLSGTLNETVLAGGTLKLGMLRNLYRGILPRMLLGFTRTGGPIMRDKQSFLIGAGIPVSIGKMPKLINTPVENHHEVVALYNAMDGRF